MNELNEKLNALDQNAKILIYLIPLVVLVYFGYETYTDYSYEKDALYAQINKNKTANYNYKIKKLKIKIRKKEQTIPNLNIQVDNKKDEVYAIKDRLQGGVKTLLSPMAIAGIVQDILSWSISEKVDLTNLTREYIENKNKKSEEQVNLKQIITVDGESSYNSFLQFLENIEEMKMMSKISDVVFNLEKNTIKFTYKLQIFGITLDGEDI